VNRHPQPRVMDPPALPFLYGLGSENSRGIPLLSSLFLFFSGVGVCDTIWVTLRGRGTLRRGSVLPFPLLCGCSSLSSLKPILIVRCFVSAHSSFGSVFQEDFPQLPSPYETIMHQICSLSHVRTVLPVFSPMLLLPIFFFLFFFFSLLRSTPP